MPEVTFGTANEQFVGLSFPSIGQEDGCDTEQIFDLMSTIDDKPPQSDLYQPTDPGSIEYNSSEHVVCNQSTSQARIVILTLSRTLRKRIQSVGICRDPRKTRAHSFQLPLAAYQETLKNSTRS